MAKSRLHELSELGQSVWIDYLSRQMLQSGEARPDDGGGRRRRRHLEPDDLPEGDRRGRRLRRAAARGARRGGRPEGGLPPAGRRRTCKNACDLLRPVWDGGKGQDGYVSIEVDPNLAFDTDGTIAEAQRLHELVDKPNCFVKIPATKDGLPAIEEMIARGRSINVTLIFSLQRYVEVVEAYLRGLERLVESGGDPGRRGVGGELLRLARGHRGRQAAGRGRRARRAEGQARGRQRQARLPALQGALLGRALGGARGQGRDGASAASGPRPRPRTRPTATCSTSRS